MLTKYNQVLAFLGFATRLNEQILNYDVYQTLTFKVRGKALELLNKGRPYLHSIGGGKLGNCFNSHHDICFNYDESDLSKPYGMSGYVEPYQTGEVSGVKYALFKYSIDSGG